MRTFLETNEMFMKQMYYIALFPIIISLILTSSLLTYIFGMLLWEVFTESN